MDSNVLRSSKEYSDDLGLVINADGTIGIDHNNGQSIDVVPTSIEKDTINGLFSGIAWDGGEPDTTWYEELKENQTGSELMEYEMSTAAEVAGLLELINEGEDLSNLKVTLANDIDFLDSEITIKTSVVEGSSLSTQQNSNIYGASENELVGFSGEFDGAGYVISNLTLVYEN